MLPNIATAMILVALCAQSASARFPVDVLGDPLPPGAVARLGTMRFHHHCDSGVTAVTYSPDEKLIASAGGVDIHTVRLWDAATGKLLQAFRLPGFFNYHNAFSPDSRWLACA